jgi:hypothetical protein
MWPCGDLYEYSNIQNLNKYWQRIYNLHYMSSVILLLKTVFINMIILISNYITYINIADAY